MVGSFWRYSHFLLAIVSALFLVIAAISGAILAVEPITEQAQPYAVTDLSKVKLSETIKVLQSTYNEVLDIEITAEHFVKASIVSINGDSKSIYINPIDGENLGDVVPQSPFFSFITNLHRSLFLKSIGRGFVGVVSFLLCFIAITGIFLLAQRQGGLKKWFTKVKETDTAQRYHVILGRWFLLPIVILATTGVYLSLEKFSLLPKDTTTHDWSSISNEASEKTEASEFSLFKKLSLNNIRKVTFPFSDAAEDYFEIDLNDKALLIHQYNGTVVSELQYPFVTLASRLSLQLHTGRGSMLWSLVLLLSCLSLLFFIYSGISIRLKRSKNTKSTVSKWTKGDAEYILLVGSETGTTYSFAKAFYKALENEGKTIHLATLNDYTTYEKATHLIIFTATYGDGDSPSNARKFESLLNTIQPIKHLQFSVLGFGSLLYPNYCSFAIKTNNLLNAHPNFKSITSLVKINDQSEIAFKSWVNQWNKNTGMNAKVLLPNTKHKTKKQQLFTVIEKTPLNVDNTVLIRLRCNKKRRFQSGDLLNVIPPEATIVRQYSIAEIDGDILLSIKWHPNGVCSTYLCALNIGDTLSASIEKNETFHFPKQAPSVWLIANGTGIAPYLGMLNKQRKTPIRLLWGGRTEASFDCYKDILKDSLLQDNIKDCLLAFSQVAHKTYVQDMLLKQQAEIAKAIKAGGVFMLCGSIAMQNSVLEVLEDITINQLQQPLSDFENNGQLLMDCY